MKNIFFFKTYGESSGMTNQIFSIITEIFIALNNNKNIIIFDDFSLDFDKKETIPISKIINLEHLNIILKNCGYEVLLFDKNNIYFKIEYVTYGISNMVVDVTKQIKCCCLNEKNQIFFLSKDTDLDHLFGNYFPGKKKLLTIHYSINNHLFKIEYNEKREEDIVFDLKKLYFHYYFSWIDSFHRGAFEHLLNNIQFDLSFKKMADQFIEKKICSSSDKSLSKINVLHLRLENDAIEHWSKNHKMNCELTPEEFRERWESKYIEVIKKNIGKTEENIILSYSTNNSVIDYLKENGYSYCFIEKQEDKGREWNAIIDFHIALYCNNIFLGIWNNETLEGSTFSYFISEKVKCKKIFLDIYNLDKEEQYIY